MKAKHAPGYVPNSQYSQDDWDDVSDNPEWTKKDFDDAKPAREALPPALFEALARDRIVDDVRQHRETFAHELFGADRETCEQNHRETAGHGRGGEAEAQAGFRC